MNRIKRVLLLGTKYTMVQTFYKNKIIESGIEIMIPDEAEIAFINQVIFKELCVGRVLEDSRKRYIEIIEKYSKRGAEGVILGCTEIGMLIEQKDISIPAFDTAKIHAKKAAYFALG